AAGGWGGGGEGVGPQPSFHPPWPARAGGRGGEGEGGSAGGRRHGTGNRQSATGSTVGGDREGQARGRGRAVGRRRPEPQSDRSGPVADYGADGQHQWSGQQVDRRPLIFGRPDPGPL